MHICMYNIHMYISTYKCDVHVHVITCMYTCLKTIECTSSLAESRGKQSVCVCMLMCHVYGDEYAVYTQLPGRSAISGR